MDNSQNYFAAFPLYLKGSDIADAMQVSLNTAYELMRQSGLLIRCGKAGKSMRVHRDKFFEWLLSIEGKSIA